MILDVMIWLPDGHAKYYSVESARAAKSIEIISSEGISSIKVVVGDTVHFYDGMPFHATRKVTAEEE